MVKELSIPIWGGIECTVHRLQNNFYDQSIRNGHHQRESDLELIAELGIKTLRYPVLWEKIAPKGLDSADWTWADNRLGKLRELGITPIAGLLHHGSGPAYTNLLDPEFPEKFTEFAQAVARRYPWLELFTPINEPLTTARFSCLYGLWYPHKRDDYAFSNALFNQCKATIMAMREIKKVIPTAKLVQTEDMGKCHSTKILQYQSEFENARRWSSLDLLTGNLQNNPIMLDYFKKTAKVEQSKLDYFDANSYPPDIVGINYYITSERFIDEDQKKYPAWSRTKNTKHKYSDVDIVRADIHKREGHYNILKSVIERYNLPVALTEVHLGSTRDAQLRWFMEAYDAVSKLKQEGSDVRAITVWSIFGAYDWNTLLTQKNDFYEPGVFDVYTGKPRPTAIARLIKNLCAGKKSDHPVLESSGWWKNTEHVHFVFGTNRNSRGLPSVAMMFPENLMSSSTRPLLITGSTGTLGRAFAHICTMRNIPYILLSRSDLDITNRDRIEALIEQHEPWAVVNTAGFVNVDAAESRSEICFRENAIGPITLSKACAKYGVKFLTFSSDLVFDGSSTIPYVESSQPAPVNIYGASKLDAENSVLKFNPLALVVRTSAFFSPWDEHNFLIKMINSVKYGQTFFAANDQIISPTYVPDLVNTSLDLAIDEACGIWHLANTSALSWADFALRVARKSGLDTSLIKSVTTGELELTAKRPRFSALGTEKGMPLPNLESAIDRFFSERSLDSLIST